jgi:copper transport protein
MLSNLTKYKKILALGFILVTQIFSVSSAYAHSSVLSTNPKDGSRVESFNNIIEIKFNEKITITSQPVKIVNAKGENIANSSSLTMTPEGSTLTTKVEKNLNNGWYALLYQVTADDGHPTTGTLTFLVGPDTSSQKAKITDPAYIYKKFSDILRFLGYATSLMGFGLLTTSWVLESNLEGKNNIIRRLSGFTATLALLIAPLTIINFAMLLNAGSTDELKSVVIIALQSSVGTAILVRVSSLFALATAILLSSEKNARKYSYFAGAIGAIGISLSFAFQGHSTVVPHSFLARILLITHLLAAGLWLGGMPGLYWFYRNKSNLSFDQLVRIIKRFSLVATTTVVIVLFCGIALGVLMFTKPSDITTKYGISLLIKFTLVLLVALLGAYNHFKVLPMLDKKGIDQKKEIRKLKNSLKVEAIGFIAILLATTYLTSSGAPAAGNDHGLVGHSHGAPDLSNSFSSAPEVLQGVLGDGGIELAITPAVMNQEVTITSKVTDAIGKQAEASSIILYFTNKITGIGPIERKMEKLKDGTFVLKTRDLAISGEWEIKTVVKVSTLQSLEAKVTAVIAPDASTNNTNSDLGFTSVTPIIENKQLIKEKSK